MNIQHVLHAEYAYKYGKCESSWSNSLKATTFTVIWNNGGIFLKVEEVRVKNRTVGLHNVTVLSKFYFSHKT